MINVSVSTRTYSA